MRVYVPEPTVASAKLRSRVAGRPARFAREVGCTLSSLKNWLGGYNRPSPHWRQRLAASWLFVSAWVQQLPRLVREQSCQMPSRMSAAMTIC